MCEWGGGGKVQVTEINEKKWISHSDKQTSILRLSELFFLSRDLSGAFNIHCQDSVTSLTPSQSAELNMTCAQLWLEVREDFGTQWWSLTPAYSDWTQVHAGVFVHSYKFCPSGASNCKIENKKLKLKIEMNSKILIFFVFGLFYKMLSPTLGEFKRYWK